MKKLLLLFLISISGYSQGLSIQEETDSTITINMYNSKNGESQTTIYKKSSVSMPLHSPEVMEIKGVLHYVNRYIYTYIILKGEPKAFEFVEWASEENPDKKVIIPNYINSKTKDTLIAKI